MLKGDTLYIFSNGYALQLGGLTGKRFSKNKFKELLLAIQDKEMAEQEKILNENLNQWKGHSEQMVDILIIGV